ncbi:MAG: hypothetical protein ACTHPD_09780 [Rhizomicrobium sp.]
MIAVEISNPTNGAAYQVLFEQFLPDYCNTRERQKEILAGFAKVAEWAQTQPPDVMAGYMWAMQKMTEDMERRIKISDLGSQVQAIYQIIPRPEIDR